MSQVQITLPDYLRPPCENLWAWSDRGDTIVWSRNTQYGPVERTVAFAPQLAIILEELHNRIGGLPPLTCVLEVMDACSARWEAESCKGRIIRLTTAASHLTRAIEVSSPPVVAITGWLHKVNQLPMEYRSDVESQVAVLTYAWQDARQYLFEVSGLDANDVIACVSVPAEDRDVAWADSAAASHSVSRVKRTSETLIHMSRRAIDADAIRLWRESNVGSLPTTQALDAPPPQNPIARSLRELAADQQWGAIARSAIAAASLLSLPRRPSDPDHLPIGGVSDVTNRGQPERLLMTELAQDPMVMLARIANGQALYLRRESPPGPSPDIRPVFLESGIRTWGNTRLRIASVAMAIAAAEECRGESSAKLLTVAGRRHFAEDFTTTDGMIAHLSRTEIDEHPGEAIARWLESVDEQENPIAEPIAVVSAATDADERFRRALDSVSSGLLVARVERDLSVTLLRRTPLGDQVLQSLSLDSVEASQQVASPVDPVVRTTDSSLALFLDLDPCPLLFTDSLDGGWFAATDAPGLFTITRDCRLLWFAQRGAGGVQLFDRMPHSFVHAYETGKHRIAMVVGREEHYLVEADAVNGAVDVIRLSETVDDRGRYAFDDGCLFRFSRHKMQLIDRISGHIADQTDFRFPHIGGAMIANGRHLTLISGQAGKLEPHAFVVDGDQDTFVLAARDSDNTIVLVNQDYSQFVRFADEQPEKHASNTRITRKGSQPTPPKVVYRSASGNQLVVHDDFMKSGDTPTWHHLSIDLKRHSIAPIRFSNLRTLLYEIDSDAYQLLQPRNYLSRFTAVEFCDDGSLAVVKQNRKWKLQYSQQHDKLMLQAAGSSLDGVRHGFGRMVHLDRPYGRTHWNLRPLQIGDNHVVADSRGLLHLRRGYDGTELTLMLHQDHVSGWASWGEVFGDQYYLSGNTVPVSPAVLHWIEEFALQCNQSS